MNTKEDCEGSEMENEEKKPLARFEILGTNVEIYGEKDVKKGPKFRHDRFRALIGRRGLSYGQLSVLSGVSKSMITHLANSNRESTSIEIAAKLTAALGTSIEYLANLTDDPRPFVFVEDETAKQERNAYHVLTEQEQAVMDAIHSLDDAQRALVLQLIESLRK